MHCSLIRTRVQSKFLNDARLACINHNGAEGRYRATRAWNVIFSLTTVNTKLPRAFIVECATTLSRVGNGVSMTQRYQIVWRDAKWEDVTRVKRECYAVATANARETFTKWRSTFPFRESGRQFICLYVGFRLSRLQSRRKANGRSADVGITQLCIVPSEAKKLLAPFAAPSFPLKKQRFKKINALVFCSSTSRKS